MARSLAELRQYLAGEWLFDNNFKDTSGNGNHGTPTDIEWASTCRGLKPRFNGSSSVVNCGTDNSLNCGLNDISISMWVKSHGADGTDTLFRSGATGGSNNGGIWIRQLNMTTISVNICPTIGLRIIGTITIPNELGTRKHICITFDRSGNCTVYVNGVAVDTPFDISAMENAPIANFSSTNIGFHSSTYAFDGDIEDVRQYHTLLTPSEALTLYNATSAQTGVKISEFSYQHDPAAVIPVTADTVLQIGGKLAGDAVDTISDRALSNDATILGPMPTGDGFLAGGRRFNETNNDYISIPNSNELKMDGKFSIRMIVRLNTIYNYNTLFMKDQYYSGIGAMVSHGGQFAFYGGGSGAIFAMNNFLIASDNMVDVCIDLCYDLDTIKLYKNGGLVAQSSSGITITKVNTADIQMGLSGTNSWQLDGIIKYFSIINDDTCESNTGIFNTLAVLPFWSINYRDYPDNVTTYTDRFPHSSTIIASGAFKVDDDKIQCASAGTLTYSASHEFDGAEYITITIAGTEYSGTGTITQGNTTVSVAQGSNKITVAMGTGDTIDKIRIQFRATV